METESRIETRERAAAGIFIEDKTLHHEGTKCTKFGNLILRNLRVLRAFVVEKSFTELSNCSLVGLVDASFQARIKPQRVVPEDLALQLIADVFAIDQVGNVMAEVALVAFVGVVRGPD